MDIEDVTEFDDNIVPLFIAGVLSLTLVVALLSMGDVLAENYELDLTARGEVPQGDYVVTFEENACATAEEGFGSFNHPESSSLVKIDAPTGEALKFCHESEGSSTSFELVEQEDGNIVAQPNVVQVSDNGFFRINEVF